MPTPTYMPDLNQALKECRNALLVEVEALSENAMLASSLMQNGGMDKRSTANPIL